jgi:hypothetical protein
MNGPRRKDGGSSDRNTNRFFTDSCSERSRFHTAFFALMEMDVWRRPARSRRERAVNGQNGLAIGVTHTSHPQDLSGVPILQMKVAFH